MREVIDGESVSRGGRSGVVARARSRSMLSRTLALSISMAMALWMLSVLSYS